MAYLTAGVDCGERPLDRPSNDVVYAVEVKINNVLLIGVYRILFCLIRDGYSMHYGGHGIRFKSENFMRISMDNGKCFSMAIFVLVRKWILVLIINCQIHEYV